MTATSLITITSGTIYRPTKVVILNGLQLILIGCKFRFSLAPNFISVSVKKHTRVGEKDRVMCAFRQRREVKVKLNFIWCWHHVNLYDWSLWLQPDIVWKTIFSHLVFTSGHDIWTCQNAILYSYLVRDIHSGHFH